MSSPEQKGLPTEFTHSKTAQELLEQKMVEGGPLTDLDLCYQDLAGSVHLEGKNFSRSDIRGLVLYHEATSETDEVKTNIRNTTWMDTVVAATDNAEAVDFRHVDAEGATFGFTADLVEHRALLKQRLDETGIQPPRAERNAYYLFWGRDANFKNTKWVNIDFGGDGSADEISFRGADLQGAVFDGCDMSGIDLSVAKNIEKIKILRPVTLQNMKISRSQVDAVIRAIDLQDNEHMQNFAADIEDFGEEEALQQFFEIDIVEN